jgi:hypothetical protein
MNWLLSMAVAIYLVAAIAFGLYHHSRNTGPSVLDSAVHGLTWPAVVVEILRSPSS